MSASGGSSRSTAASSWWEMRAWPAGSELAAGPRKPGVAGTEPVSGFFHMRPHASRFAGPILEALVGRPRLANESQLGDGGYRLSRPCQANWDRISEAILASGNCSFAAFDVEV